VRSLKEKRGQSRILAEAGYSFYVPGNFYRLYVCVLYYSIINNKWDKCDTNISFLVVSSMYACVCVGVCVCVCVCVCAGCTGQVGFA
jgi:hypothetical protein